jgi:hypothetical protein
VFSSHLLLHQFGMVVRGGCEAMVYGFQVALDVHLNWVVF